MASAAQTAQVQQQWLASNPVFTLYSATALHSQYLEFNGSVESIMGSGNTSIAMVMENSTQGPAVALFADRNSSAEYGFVKNVSSLKWKEYLHDGSMAKVYAASNDTFIYYSTVPYSYGSSDYLIDMYVVWATHGSASNISCMDPYDYFYTTISNIALLNPDTFNGGIDAGYCMVSRWVR